MKKKGFLFFAVYILVLVGIGVMAVTRAGETSRRKISIYKEATPEDGIGPGTEALQEVLHLTREAEILEVAELPQKQEYNGLRLDDNGMPYAIRINRTLNIVTVYSLDDEGHYTVPVRAMRCSISLDDTTPVGLFTTTEKRLEWAFLQGNVYGQYAYQIHGGIYFHSVPYTENKHDKLETWEYNKLGEGASLGCIRLCVADVKWIYENCLPGTQVYLFNSDYPGPLGRPQQPYTFADVSETGWDPTDTADDSPYEGTAAIYGAEDHTIKIGEPFDSRTGVMAFSSDRQNVTDRLMVDGTVDNQIPGEYKLAYSFYDNGKKIERDIFIRVVDTEAPVITMLPDRLYLAGYHGDKEELADLIARNITAYDNEKQIIQYRWTPEKDTTEDAELVIDLSRVEDIPGSYEISCYAEDAAGNRSESYTIWIELE